MMTVETPRTRYSYDGRLRENPNIEGRVEVSFTIAGGRVTTASLFANTTGDAQLGNCIVGRVRGWRCSGVDDAEIIYPYILAK